MDLDELRSAGSDELEALYASERPVRLPEGVYRGEALLWLPAPRDRLRLLRPTLWLLFGLSPFGVDFDLRCWYFVSARAPRVGLFSPLIGRSRWRETTTVQLRYEVSQLPGPVRALLYDEVKPLTADLCLGIGGLNAERGRGEQFFFGLERIRGLGE